MASKVPDFSTLPDIVWVNVLSFLDLPTRNHVAQTCRTLNDVFCHPTLWHTAKVTLFLQINLYSVYQLLS